MYYHDTTFWLYAFLTLVCVYGFIFFFSWLIQAHFRATAVFWYVTILFGGLAIQNAFNMCARALKFQDLNGAEALFMSHWWTYRLIIPAIILTMFCAHMTIQRCKFMRTWAGEDRRKGERRGKSKRKTERP